MEKHIRTGYNGRCSEQTKGLSSLLVCHAWERPAAPALGMVWGTKKPGNELQCNVTNMYHDSKGNESCRSWHFYLSGVGEEPCVGYISKLHYVHLVNTTL